MMQSVRVGIYVALLSGDSFLGHDQKWSDTSCLYDPQVSLCSLFDFSLFAAGWGKSFRGWRFCRFSGNPLYLIRKMNNSWLHKKEQCNDTKEMLVNTCDQLICVYVGLQWICNVICFAGFMAWCPLPHRMIYCFIVLMPSVRFLSPNLFVKIIFSLCIGCHSFFPFFFYSESTFLLSLQSLGWTRVYRCYI